MNQIRPFAVPTILFLTIAPLFAQPTHVTGSSRECDEFISGSPCQVKYDMKLATPDSNGMYRAPTHADVQVGVHTDAAIHLVNASPFLACTVQATPAAPTRDLSTSVTGALTILGTLGAISAAPEAELVAPQTDYASILRKEFKEKIKPWVYTYDSVQKAQDVVRQLYKDLKDLLQEEKDDEGKLTGGSAYVLGQLQDLRKVRDTIQQYFDVLRPLVDDNGNPKSSVTNEILIPMDRFRQKAVSETITCKDAATQTQPFATMTFTAYYENTPVFDISAGAIMSLTPGRQVGVVSGPYGPAAPSTTFPTACVGETTPLSCLGVTSQSKVQFMPAAFVEWHTDWKWPGAHNGKAYHPFGYVGSLGPAFGISVNPNNGTASAEFFEGMSLGIHRVAIMAGFHNGRYQTFADGYYVGEAVASTVTAPRTERIWTTHFAIAVSYRIPFR